MIHLFAAQRAYKTRKELTGNGILRDLSGVERVGTLSGKTKEETLSASGGKREIGTDSSRVLANFFR